MSKKAASQKIETPEDVSVLERRVLIFAPTGNDAQLTLDFLVNAKISGQAFRDVTPLCAEVARGCGVIVLAEEALAQSSIIDLVDALAGQPSWSDIPIVLITSGGEVGQTRLRRLNIFGSGGNVIVLERPFRPATLVSTVEVALRSRQRQYEARRLVQDLHEARAHMEAALGVADIATWTWDLQSNLVHGDKNMLRMFSIGPEDAENCPVEKYFQKVHPDDVAPIQAANQVAMESESGEYEADHRVIQARGVRWVTSRGKVEKDATGKPVFFWGVNIDITERKQAEAILRQNEALFSELVERAPTGVYVVDSQFRFQQLNALAMPVFAQVEPKIGRDFGEVMEILWGPQVGGEVTKIFRHTLMTGERYVSPRFSEMRHDIGEEQAYDWEVQRMTLPDGTHGVVCYFNDITARLKSEQALLQAKATAESASRAKDDFLAALSHELRTPLNPALLIASEAATDEKLPEEVRQNFETIRKSIELEARLIDDLLDLTRITTGKMVLEKNVVDVHDVLLDALATVKADQLAKNIQITNEFANVPSQVSGDAVRLEQIFWNILKNAVKFTPANGKVHLQTSVADGRLKIQVTDTGMGMNANEVGRVFEAFAQGEHASGGGSHRFGGLGLGLAISKKLVEVHAGKIFAESAGHNRGAVFTVELPLAQKIESENDSCPEADGTSPVEIAKSDGAQISVLLVEDHDATRTVLAQLLMRRNYKVIHTNTIASARTLAGQNKFDLLISDIGLPDGNGNDLMKEFQERYGLKGIALTGYGMEEDIERGKAAGFVTHLIKPVRIQSLEKALSVFSKT